LHVQEIGAKLKGLKGLIQIYRRSLAGIDGLGIPGKEKKRLRQDLERTLVRVTDQMDKRAGRAPSLDGKGAVVEPKQPTETDEPSSPDAERPAEGGREIEKAFQVLDKGERGVIRVGEREIAVPSIHSSERELKGFTRFLKDFQLDNIERRKQKNLNKIVKESEIDILRDRTEAIVQSHKAMTKACLTEVLLAAHEYGLQSVRNAEIANQESLQNAILKVAVQYADFLRKVPKDLPPTVFAEVQGQALQIYKEALAKVRSATFDKEE
jgi:hypothetical protein